MTSINLVPSWRLNDLSLTTYPYGVDADSAVDIGEPEVLVNALPGSLADGDIEQEQRAGNRTYVLPVWIEGASLGEVAKNEAALRQTIRLGRLTLTHDSGDPLAPPSVYEVLVARMKLERQDITESHLLRKAILTLTCAPYARSADPVTVEALSPPVAVPTTVTVNNADTTAGFSATKTVGLAPSTTSAIAVIDQGAYVSTTATETDAFSVMLNLAVSPTVSMSATKYLTIEASGSVDLYFAATLNGAGSYLTPALTRATSNGVLYVFDTAGKALSSVQVYTKLDLRAGTRTHTVSVYDVSRTDTLPQVTKRQASRTIEVGGTERTPASIRVATAGTPLNFTAVHTSPSTLAGYSPPLRRWRTSGNTVTADNALISGGREPVNLTPIEAQVPLMSLPEGEYVLAAVMRSTVAGTFPITWTANSLIPGYGFLGPTVSGVAQARFFDPGFWNLIPLDVITLPPVRATNSLAVVALTLNRAPIASEVIDIDEWWAFRVGEDSALTIVSTPATRLWLDSPDVTSSVPRVWVGDFNNRADARHPGSGLYAQGNHILHPDGTTVFVASNGSDSPSVTATFHKRWHSNAAE